MGMAEWRRKLFATLFNREHEVRGSTSHSVVVVVLLLLLLLLLLLRLKTLFTVKLFYHTKLVIT